jgi:DNA polymerase III delta prime subunit
MINDTVNDTVNDLKLIAEKYGIKEFVKVESGDQLCIYNGEDCYINKSYICGQARIELGIYENIELMIISFFHELGHIVNSVGDFYNSEEKAWKIGFKLAESYEYNFSDETHKWCEEQLATYK